MGQREFGPKLYYQFSLERLIPDDHLLRRIAERVDFSFIRRLCRPYYSHTGQPSVDPVVLFKLLLVGYLYGITSERRLAEEVRLNLAYRWFLGYDLDESTPDHSVLSKLRARLPAEVFEGFFQRSIELCREVGLLTEGPVYVDSTLIRGGRRRQVRDRTELPLSRRARDPGLHPDLPLRPPAQGDLGARALPVVAGRGCLPLPGGPVPAPREQRTPHHACALPGTQRGLLDLSFPCGLCSDRERPEPSPIVGAGLRRRRRAAAGESAGKAAHGRAEDLCRGDLRAGKGAARAATNALPGSATGAGAALAHGSGDEHQEGGEGRYQDRLVFLHPSLLLLVAGRGPPNTRFTGLATRSRLVFRQQSRSIVQGRPV